MFNINLHIGYFNHRKTRRLVGLLGNGAELLPLRLWCYAAEYHGETGGLTGYSVQEIEAIAEWRGEAGAMVEAMVKVGFLEKKDDGYVVHHWLDHNGHIAAFKERAKKGARARWERIKGKEDTIPSNANDATSTASGNASDAPSNALSTATSNAQPMLEQSPNQRTNQQPNRTVPTSPTAPTTLYPRAEANHATAQAPMQDDVGRRVSEHSAQNLPKKIAWQGTLSNYLAATRSLSPEEWRRFFELEKEFGNEALMVAVKKLHSGVSNVIPFLEAVLRNPEKKDKMAIEIDKFLKGVAAHDRP